MVKMMRRTIKPNRELALITNRVSREALPSGIAIAVPGLVARALAGVAD